MKTALVLILAVTGLTMSAHAKAPEGQGPQLKYFNPADVTAAALLPAPVTDGSAIQKAELAELQALAKTRSPERLKQAQFDDNNISPVIFQSVVPGFDPAKLPLTTKLLEAAKREGGLVSHMAKEHFDRKRPYEFDASLNVCSVHRGKNATYPSGHTTAGFAMAAVLGHMLPSHAGAAMSRAVVYGESRMNCGVHYRSDVAAGQVIGTAVALALLQNPKFQAELSAAKAELAAAGLTK
jgi:acid phosphatase (class A)